MPPQLPHVPHTSDRQRPPVHIPPRSARRPWHMLAPTRQRGAMAPHLLRLARRQPSPPCSSIARDTLTMPQAFRRKTRKRMPHGAWAEPRRHLGKRRDGGNTELRQRRARCRCIFKRIKQNILVANCNR
ncbi:hypothetical protein GUJ93_ZPchr0002g23943 [Zizania palustris]|uniref:Uncharacterized protein n=1 Tax=Zizania palustris TaxID=103762 RepID=A0A8J5RXJ6_ZIZPA|nr:hypothetical protein GUJ93_ZPchr0002g23943 [Zizania palustris]